MVRLRFETDLATSLKASQDLAKATEKVANTYTKSAKEANALERAAKRIVDQNLLPAEKFNRQLQRLALGAKSGAISMQEAERTAGRLRQRLDDTTRSSEKAFGPAALSNLKSYAAGVISISGAVALIRSEFEAMKREAEKIAQAQLGAAPARDVLKRNIAGLPQTQRQQFEQRAGALAAELSLPQNKIDVALAEAYSASGGNVEQAFQQVRTAGQFLKTAPDQIGSFSGALGDVSKGTGDANAMRNLGFMVRIGAMSRVADAQKQAASIPQALAGARAFGATGEQAGALFAALSVAAADIEGAISGTGTIRTAEQLADFFDKQVIAKKFKPEAVDTFAERLRVLRRNPQLAREFVDKASFEAKVKGPLQQFLLDPSSAIAQDYRRNIEGFGSAAAQRDVGKMTISYLGQGQLARTAATERAIASHTEQFRLTREAQLTQESREAVIERSAQLGGTTRLQARIGAFGRSGFTMSPEEATSILKSDLNHRQRDRTLPADPELIKNTQAMIEELKGIQQAVRDVRLEAPKPSGRQE